MTATRQDVQAVSAGPQPGGVPLSADQLDRITAVLNRHSTHRPPAGTRPRQQVLDVMQRAGYRPEQIQEAKGLLPESVDSHRDSVALAMLGLSQGELMDRMGSSP